MLFSFVPHAPLPSYPDREHGDVAPVYSIRREAELRNALAALADLAVQREIERERSGQSGTQQPPESKAA